MQAEYDILIAGAGMVGASLALALRGQPFRIGVIEAVSFNAHNQPSYDARTTALSYGTRRIFQGMQVWEHLADRVAPIKKIHVSAQGRFGYTRLDAAEQGLEALGYVIENAALGELFAQSLNTQANVELICPAQVNDLVIKPESATVSVRCGNGEREERSLSARLVVVADGRKSMLRERLGIATDHQAYGQSALITNISTERPHSNVAYERFSSDGSLALLPMRDNRCAVVWCLADPKAQLIRALDDSAFLEALQKHFGQRLGSLCKVGARHAYPLALTRSRELVRERLALIGNAAQSLHPIAAQGFNLGLRDVAVFAEVLADASRAGQEIGGLQVLQGYVKRRRQDHRRVIGLTDTLVRFFSHGLAPLSLVQSAGMLAADLLPPFKKAIVRQGMGLSGWQPRLARGLDL